MVKPDLKHNYYTDLDLPTTASLDDIRKSYRKLALQYHPDRNAGRESECVPRFQAIQAANEILSDPATKTKYDLDRRKAGLYPSPMASKAPTSGFSYAATSDFPPPPRRTAPGTWQRPGAFGGPARPSPAANAAPGTAPVPGPVPGAVPTGADRFANFPRQANGMPKKDSNAERTQQFRAWQATKNGPERPRAFNPAPPPPPRDPQPGAAPTRPNPQRQDTKMPSEEQIRAGMRHGAGKAAHPGYDPDSADAKASAWSAFAQQRPGAFGKPGVGRSNTQRTPRKSGGFDPNAPGSDERPAPQAGGNYSHRHRSEDFGSPLDGVYPPPPPGPPPAFSSDSPTSPLSQGPAATPLRPFKSRTTDEEVPYAEGNRKSTPYTSFIGERTQFSSEGLRRSASTRDTIKLYPDGASKGARARSTSPLGRQPRNTGQQTGLSSSSEDSSDSDPELTHTPENLDGTQGHPERPNTAPTNSGLSQPSMNTLRKKAVPRSQRPPGFANVTSPVPGEGIPQPGPTDRNMPSMQQRQSGQNMYAHSPFGRSAFLFQSAQSHFKPGFPPINADSTSSRKPSGHAFPAWAIPSQVPPPKRDLSHSSSSGSVPGAAEARLDDNLKLPKRIQAWPQVSIDERNAYSLWRSKLWSAFETVEPELDINQFLKDASTARSGKPLQSRMHDELMREVLSSYSSVGCDQKRKESADPTIFTSFTFANSYDPLSKSKSRSEDNINTEFSPDGFSGTFTGAPGYFPPQNIGRKSSPAHRVSQRQKSGLRSATADAASPDISPSADTIPSPLRRPDSDGNTPQTKPTLSTGASAGTQQDPHVVEDDGGSADAVSGYQPTAASLANDTDAMDIDTTPPSYNRTETAQPDTPTQSTPFTPFSWIHNQARRASGHPQTSTAAQNIPHAPSGGRLNTNLGDLSNVEPLAKSTDHGFGGLADMASTLPFPSKAANVPPRFSRKAATLGVPRVPVAPVAPNKLTRASWKTYTELYAKYVKEYHIWNHTMLEHFNTREKTAEERILGGMDWLVSVGEPVGHDGSSAPPRGFFTYMKEVQEDVRVREAWNLGWEKHGAALEAFDKVRDRVQNLAQTGVLQDV